MSYNAEIGVVVMKEGGARGALALGNILDQPDGEFATLIQPTGVPRDPELTRYCPSLGVAVVPLRSALIDRLLGDERVASAGQNRQWDVGRTTFQPVAGDVGPLRSLEPPTSASLSPSLISIGLNYSYTKATGRGVRVAVVDTGVDVTHPDLPLGQRVVDHRCFLAGRDPKDVHDLHGHGTMSAGLIAASAATAWSHRYSVAPEALLIVAKAMNDHGKGYEADILEAICWAVMKGAKIINLSIGVSRERAAPADPDYELLGSRLNAQGVLLVAAAGDGSTRPARLAPVDDPAACRSIMAVGAVNEHYAIADFSPATLDHIGAIDLCAPGVGVYCSTAANAQGSHWNAASGTSASAPFVCGVAALHLELDPNLTVDQLTAKLKDEANRSPARIARDFGSGIVRVPK